MKFMEAAKGTHLCRSSSDRLEAHGAPDLKPGLAENPQGYHASIEPIPKIPREFPQISGAIVLFQGQRWQHFNLTIHLDSRLLFASPF